MLKVTAVRMLCNKGLYGDSNSLQEHITSMTLPINCPDDGSPMSCIIGADELARDFTDRINDFVVAAGSSNANIKTVEEKVTLELIVAYLDDLLSARMRWSRPTYAYENLLEKVFPWFAPIRKVRTLQGVQHIECELSGQFNEQIISVLEEQLNDFVDELVEDRTWKVWSMTRLGKDIVLLEGPDFRILDWERRIQSGEWKRE